LHTSDAGLAIDERALAQLGSWGRLRVLVEEAVTAGDLEFDLAVHSRECAPGVFAAERS
jgi:hypothetical protein